MNKNFSMTPFWLGLGLATALFLQGCGDSDDFVAAINNGAFTDSTNVISQVVFVDNTAPGGGDGSLASPFNNLDDAVAVVTAGETIFVGRGDGTNTGQNNAITLPDGVDLVGEGTGLVLAQTIVPAGTAPLVTGPITCGGNNEIRGLNIQGSGGTAINATGVSNVVVQDNSISDANGRLILFTNVGGTASITDNAFSLPTNDADDWVQFNNNNTNATFRFTDNTFDNSTLRGTEDLCQVELTGNSVVTCDLSRNVATSDAVDAFDFGLFVVVEDSAVVTANIEGNQLRSFADLPIELFAFGPNATINGTVSTNSVSNVTNDNGIAVDSASGTITVSGNTLTNINDDGIDIDAFGRGGVVVVDGNTISNCLEDGIDVEGSAPSDDIVLGIRNNSVTTTTEDSIDVDWSVGAGNLCVDLVGNTVDGQIQIDQLGPGGTVQVEQLSTLSALNGGATVGSLGAVSEVADGTCVFP